ncbi:hypothetical protein HGB07_07385, partial [Candidatus Roizmanbacteria bacterium]|nr:hypothetical protein [Candidatus Roizmanbacteria bacterium]
MAIIKSLVTLLLLTVVVGTNSSAHAINTGKAPTATPVPLNKTTPGASTTPILLNGKDIPAYNCGVAGTKYDKCCRPNDLGAVTPMQISPKAGINIGPFPIGIDVPGADQINDKMQQVYNLQTAANSKKMTCIFGDQMIDPNDPQVCTCVSSTTPSAVPAVIDLCNKYMSGIEKDQCITCAKVGLLWTGLGCIPLKVNYLTEYVLRMGIGLGGTFALFGIIYGAFQIQLSRGQPDKLKKNQEMITSYIIGLLLIIFSLFILQFIGVDILKIDMSQQSQINLPKNTPTP